MDRDLKAVANDLRCTVMRMIHKAGSGHPGASLSAVEIVTALFFKIMRHDPKHLYWPERDRFFMSKGHAAPLLYAALAKSGYFPQKELSTLRKMGSRLQGHPSCKCPGVEVGTGSLGQGFSVAAGTAWALKSDGLPGRVFALLGDGECNEGIVWEAALFANHHGLNNLTAIVDCNGFTNDGVLEQIMNMEPMADKWKAFGWEIAKVDGHDLDQLSEALGQAGATSRCILAKTRKGKGARYLETDKSFHTKAPDKEQLQSALADLRSLSKE